MDRSEEPPGPARLVSIRGLVAAAFTFAGAIHLLLAVSRAPGWRVEASGFAAVGVAQLLVGFALVVTDQRVMWWIALFVALIPFTVWLSTRTAGYPFGPWDGVTLEVHGLEVLVAVAEVAAGVTAALVLLTNGRVIGPHGVRLDTVAPLLLVLAAVPGMVATEAVDNYLVEPSGQTHTHN